MNPSVRRYTYSRLCVEFNQPRVYPVYDTHSASEVARYLHEYEAQDECDNRNRDAVLSEMSAKVDSENKND